MRVLISAEGNHEPAGHHYMVVDNHGFLVDLSNVMGTLTDPTIKRVEWVPTVAAGQVREGGAIVRADGSRQQFWDASLLKPYLDAWTRRRVELAAPSATA